MVWSSKTSAATTDVPHLSYDAQALSRARVIAVLIPGALSRGDIFAPVQRWQEAGYGLATYRFPGLDSRPLSPALKIEKAAAEIADLASAHPDTPFRLLGFSTGAPIALSAAHRMRNDVKVAGLSPAVERGGGTETALRTTRLILSAAWRVRSGRLRKVWLEYYRLLLFGTPVLSDQTLSIRAAQIIDGRADRIVFPEGGMPKAHMADLRRWRLPKDTAFEKGQIRFFQGLEDPVFSPQQVTHFARQIGGVPVTGYADQGHLMFASHLPVFDDIFDFFEGRPPRKGGGIAL
ncbi:alpha/beta fold hydrolase [Roseobacter sp. OBYS 0001]|uniref:alpha/beta fold hydrolase n=1 Tax=Roseobacter sp. OBYS 0001 TaxID=882651 RepID=UPI00217F4FEA|nr:alpha/beta hydrolase [Roseobacter sp. OBYS 0001]